MKNRVKLSPKGPDMDVSFGYQVVDSIVSVNCVPFFYIHRVSEQSITISGPHDFRSDVINVMTLTRKEED